MAQVTIIVLGNDRVQAAVRRRSAPALTATAVKANEAAVQAIQPFIAAEAPYLTGATQRSVKILDHGMSARVGPTTWYKHFVIGGTKRGVKPNPWVGRGARKGRPAAKAAFRAVYFRDVKR